MLRRSLDTGFNVFDVMHHGTHEKQLSNVFAWLLDTRGSHRLDDTFQRIFLEEVNQARRPENRLPETGYRVQQEVDTAGPEEHVQDIADLVLLRDDAVIVVENYYTSDGHGHCYKRYLAYSERDGRRPGTVVLLCQEDDSSRQTEGWEQATVVTYRRVLERLWNAVEGNRRYQQESPDSYWFISQMYRKFVEGSGQVEDQQALDFVVAMCVNGEAGRYAEQPHNSAEKRFADDVAAQAGARFAEGRELLMRVKERLTSYSRVHLRNQLNTTCGRDFVGEVSARYVGNYRWTANFSLPGAAIPKELQFEEIPLQLKFGPSAWFAIERDPYWTRKVDPTIADYTRLFITWGKTREIRQSAVSLQEVLDGLPADDCRLHDEMVQMIRDAESGVGS